MARTDLEKSLFKSGFLNYLGRDPEQEALAAFEASPVSIEDRLREIVNSPEYLNLQRQKAAALTQPQIGAIQTQEGLLGTQYDTSRNLLTSQYEGIANTIRQEQQRAQQEMQRQQGLQEQGLLERQNTLGLLRSGLTNTGLADLGRQTGQRIGELNFNTANRLQGLGYEQAGKLANLDISKAQNLAQLALQRAGLAQKQAEMTQGYIGQGQQSVEGTIKGLQEQRQAQQKQQYDQIIRNLQLQQEQAQLARYLANAEGQQTKANTDIISVDNRQKLIDRNTGQVIADLGAVSRAPRVGGSRGSKAASGIKQSDLNNAVNSALDILAEEDIRATGMDTGDRLLSPEERENALNKISALASQFGIDPQELYNLAWQRGGFGEWNPEEAVSNQPAALPREGLFSRINRIETPALQKMFGKRLFGRG